MLDINDDSFPVIPPHTFADIADGDVYRDAEGDYFHKTSSSYAYSFALCAIVAVNATDIVTPVSAVLVITAP